MSDTDVKKVTEMLDECSIKDQVENFKKNRFAKIIQKYFNEYIIAKNLKNIKKQDSLNLNIIIKNKEFIQFLSMDWVKNLSKIDWGKSVSIPNQYIGRDILNQYMPKGYSAYTTDDIDCPEIDISNNSPGFDIIIKCPNGLLKRVQSKLRQVTGVTHFSQQVGIETTRRNSKKNRNKNHTGHICYSADEFDYVLISAINVKEGFKNRNNINTWKFSLVPIKELIDKERGCCVTNIKPFILNKYKIID
tara:strand:+ start:401 stop:1141 length:741 start_codon:yes stop_codon:yes gene_type:complete